ncbi:hypothetical protein HVV49_08980 [Citrobacter freundii]|nr:hypothetical protein [Citrobacter freundii]
MKKALVFHGDEIGFSPFHIEISYLNAKTFSQTIITSMQLIRSANGACYTVFLRKKTPHEAAFRQDVLRLIRPL